MSIISLEDQQNIKAISPNWAKKGKETWGKTNFCQLAEEVEENKLMSLLGVALFQDLQDNPETEANTILRTGGSFEDCKGNTIKFKGINYVLAYLNYSQMVGESFVADTFTGFVKKERNDSTGLSSSERKELRNNANEMAMAQWGLIKAFLNANDTTYPLWECSASRSALKPRLRGYKKTIN